MRRAPVLLLLLLLLLPAATMAQEDAPASPELVALEADAAWRAHCAATSDADAVLATTSIAEVSAVWADVARAYERTSAPYLLYWRGVLGQCLDQEERALDDLTGFIERNGGRREYAGLLQDARRRVRMIERGIEDAPSQAGKAPRPEAAGVTVGVVLMGTAGAAGGLSAWRWGEATAVAEDLYANLYEGEELTARDEAGNAAAFQSRVLIGAAAALGVGSLVAIGIGVTRAERAREVAAVLPTVSSDGRALVLGVGGRW